MKQQVNSALKNSVNDHVKACEMIYGYTHKNEMVIRFNRSEGETSILFGFIPIGSSQYMEANKIYSI